MPVPRQPVVVHRGPGRNFAADGFAAQQGLTIVAYVDDKGNAAPSATDGVPIGDVPVIDFAAWHERLRNIPSIVVALDPALRRTIAERIAANGGAFATMSRSGAKAISESARFGTGTLIGDGPLYLGSSTTIGRHVIIMTPASVAHDIVIGDFVTIHPAAAISGHVVIGDEVVIGVGAVVVNGNSAKPLRVGKAACVCVGAVVTKSVPTGATVAGNPARSSRAAVAAHDRQVHDHHACPLQPANALSRTSR